MTGLVAQVRRLRRVIFRRRHGELIDALRRSNELLTGQEFRQHSPTSTDYNREEVAYIRKVNYRLLREYDPDATTDRSVR